MKILVLGSSGQVGAYLVEYLREKGHEVIEFDKNKDPHWQDLTMTNNAYLMECMIKADFVFFLAFDVGGSRYLKKYQHTYRFLHNNTKMMANVFEQLEAHKKPFVFASSQMSNMSYSPYGVAKKMGELYTKALGGKIVHFWNVYGIEKDMDKAHVITDFIKKGFETGDISMLTDGTEQREFLYAEDCCEALESVMENYDKLDSEDNLHITSFEATSILRIGHIIQGLFAEVGRSVTVTPAESKDEVQKDKRNEADRFITQYWNPKTTIQDGIRNVFNDMKGEFL